MDTSLMQLLVDLDEEIKLGVTTLEAASPKLRAKGHGLAGDIKRRIEDLAKAVDVEPHQLVLTRPLRLTDQAKALSARYARILEDIADAHDAAGSRGRVVVSATTSMAMWVLPHVLERMGKGQYPKGLGDVVVSEDPWTVWHGLLADGGIDMLLTPELGRRLPGEPVVLADMKRKLMYPAKGPLNVRISRLKEPIARQDLAGATVFHLPETDYPVRHGARHWRVTGGSHVQVDHLALLFSFVSQGLGVAFCPFLPSSLIGEVSSRVRWANISEETSTRLLLYPRADRPLKGVALDLFNAIVQYFREEWGHPESPPV